jgi:trigger factor
MTDEPNPTPTEPQGSTGVAEPAAETPAAETPAPETPTEEAKAEEESKLHQTVEMTDIGPCKKHIKVTVDRADIDERLDTKFSELVVDANVSGFRPGKAPRKIVERRYYKSVAEEVRGEILLASLEQLAKEHDVAPLSPPDLDPTKIEIPKAGPLVYEFNVEVRPHFDLPNYRGLRLKRPIRTFSDEDVATEEHRILSRYGQLVPKPEGNAQLGDYLIVDMTSRDGDRLLGELKEVQIRIEPRLVFKDGYCENFGELVKGASPGQTRTIPVVLSQHSADASLRGKTVQTALEIKDVKTMRLPELTHELLHEFGVHSEEQLHERVRVLLNRRLEYQQRQSAREQVLQQIAAASQWQLPEELLLRQANKAFQRRVMEMRAEGMSDEEIVARRRVLEQDALRSTALALKEHFVLQKIAEVEKLDVDDDDINDEIERMAAMNNESPRRIRARLEKEDMLDTLATEIIERKALDLILDSADYEDVPLDREEQASIVSVEEQAVPGEMQDPTAPPPPAEEAAAPEKSAGTTNDQ